MLLNVNFLAKG